MPLMIAVVVSGSGFVIAKWYENSKEKSKIRDNLILDLTELERDFLYLGFEWNKWVEEVGYSEETDKITEEMDLQRDKLTIAFIDFQVLLNRMFGKIKLYIERKLITLREYQKRSKKGESIEIEPEYWALGLSVRIATQIENSIETYKLPEDPEQLIQDFIEMRWALSSFYPDILSKKIKTRKKNYLRKLKQERKKIEKILLNEKVSHL